MTLVVKVGGAVGNSAASVVDELAHRTDVVLVHGGSDEVDRLGEALRVPSEYYTSPSGVVSRRTDAARLAILVMAMAGTVRTELVRSLHAHGARAVGLTGADGSLLVARKKVGARAVVDGRTVHVKDDLSGTIAEVRVDLLHLLLNAGIVPVVGPPAITSEGELLNVDADRVAAAVAVALHAEAMVLLTNVPGLLRDLKDPSSRVPTIPRPEFDGAFSLAAGRMRKKLLAAREALDGGVPRVVIAASAGPRPVERALRGEGTVLC